MAKIHYPPNSPDLALSYFYLKEMLATKIFDSNEEMTTKIGYFATKEKWFDKKGIQILENLGMIVSFEFFTL